MGYIYSSEPLLPPVYSSSTAYGIPTKDLPLTRTARLLEGKRARFKTIGKRIAAQLRPSIWYQLKSSFRFSRDKLTNEWAIAIWQATHTASTSSSRPAPSVLLNVVGVELTGAREKRKREKYPSKVACDWEQRKKKQVRDESSECCWRLGGAREKNKKILVEIDPLEGYRTQDWGGINW